MALPDGDFKLQIRCISSSTVSTQHHANIADLRVDALAWSLPGFLPYTVN